MNAVEDSRFRQEWERLGRELPRPRAILCVSAHWMTRGSFVTAMERPETIHDFGGFPQALFDVQYPAPGEPELAQRVVKLCADAGHRVTATADWGLDHGAWSVLVAMYPDASVPVVQLSLDEQLSPQTHFELARSLGQLRDEGVLILGSGNIVHNLRRIDWAMEAGFDWATRFDAAITRAIETGDVGATINYSTFGNDALLSVPTNEHYLPLLYVLAMRRDTDSVTFTNAECVMGSVSMRCVQFTPAGLPGPGNEAS